MIQLAWATRSSTVLAFTCRVIPARLPLFSTAGMTCTKLGNDGAAYYSLILAGCGRDDDARRVLCPSTARHYRLLCATQLITAFECL